MKPTLEQHRSKVDYSRHLCLILGGGTSLIRDLKQTPININVCKIAVNHHANILFPEYAVVEDRHTMELMKDNQDSIILGRHDLVNIDISKEVPYWRNGGMSALYIADYLGFDKILLCGFDCWKVAQRWHWHDEIFKLNPWNYDIHPEVMEAWQEVKEHLKNPERVRAMSGPLTEVFTQW